MSVDAFTPTTTEIRLPSPLNGTIYTTTRLVAAEKPTPLIGETMEAELGVAWADSLIIAASKTAGSPQKQLAITHARIPSEVDQLATNWEYSTCSIGGVVYPSVARTVIMLRDEVAHDTPAKGSAMPFEAGSIFDGKGYILADRQASGGGSQLAPVFFVERRNYIKRSRIKRLGVDALNGKILTSQDDLYYSTEIVDDEKPIAELVDLPLHAYWGIQTNGTQRSGQQLSCGWYSVTTETLIGGEMVEGVIQVASFYTNDDYNWPAVLDGIIYKLWPKLDGQLVTTPVVKYNPEAYAGPCRTLVTRQWSKNPFTIPVVSQMLPTRMNYSCPYFTINIQECLHPEWTFFFSTGTVDPVYEYITDSEKFPATTFTTWPATITAYDDQQPFRGGYLRTTKVVSKPA